MVILTEAAQLYRDAQSKDLFGWGATGYPKASV
jgi:hypothetical protein